MNGQTVRKLLDQSDVKKGQTHTHRMKQISSLRQRKKHKTAENKTQCNGIDKLKKRRRTIRRKCYLFSSPLLVLLFSAAAKDRKLNRMTFMPTFTIISDALPITLTISYQRACNGGLRIAPHHIQLKTNTTNKFNKRRRFY